MDAITRPVRDATQSAGLQFIDFGCGAGKSMAFVNTLSPGAGLGIDRSEDAVLACHARGYEAEVGDVLTYEQRNIASATYAIDLMQELSCRADLGAACINIVRAARNFSVIQHPYFDIDASLAPLGLYCEENFSKRVIYKPMVSDYILFTRNYAKGIGIVGLAIFAFGEPVITPIFEADSRPDATDFIAARTLRVVMARKDPRRFEQALERVGIGRKIYQWTQD